MSPNRIAAFGLLLVLVLLVFEYSWLRAPHSTERSNRGRQARGAPGRSGCPADPAERKDLGTADYSWSIKNLSGEEVSFSQFRGKTVFLNVWATWCGPCIAEMPDIQALQESMRGEDVIFVLLSEETLDEVKEFVQQQGIAAPVYVATSALPEVFESRGIPATFLISPQGNVVLRRLGAASWDNDNCRNYLRDLVQGGALSEPTAPPGK